MVGIARPIKNISALQGHRSKAEIKERLEREKAITGASDNIIPPKFIENNEVALEEFYRIVDELKAVGIATNVDSVLLGAYADCYSKYYESTLCMENEPLVTQYTNKTGEVNDVPNPHIKIQQQYLTMMMKLSDRYGLDPASRSKIAHLSPSDKEEKPDALMELMKGLKR